MRKPMLLCAFLMLLLQGGCLDRLLVGDGEPVPEAGEPCEGTEPQHCSATGYKSACIQGVWTSVECRGPRGCSSFSLAMCDQRRGVVGARCDPRDRWTFGACSLDGTAWLLCSDEGTFIQVGTCPGGCEPEPEGWSVQCR